MGVGRSDPAPPDAREAPRVSLRAAVEVYADERDAARALSSMAQLNPEAVGGAFDVVDHGRAEGLLSLANRLREQGQTAAGAQPTGGGRQPLGHH